MSMRVSNLRLDVWPELGDRGNLMVEYAEIHDASLPQLLRWWNGTDPPLADFDDGFLDEVAYGLTKHRPEGIAALKRDLYSDNLIRRKAALGFLAYPEVADDGEVRAALEQAFHNGGRDLKFTALWGFIHLSFFPFKRDQIASLLEGKDERMAGLAMVYLSRAEPAEAVKILEAALCSANPRMREFACDEIGDRAIEELSDKLQSLLADPDAAVAQAARSNLEFFQ